MPYIRFTKDTYHPRKRSLTPDYKAEKIYLVANAEADYFIKQGVAELFKIKLPKSTEREKLSIFFKQIIDDKKEKEKKLEELLQALKLKPQPSAKLTTPTITDKGIEEFKKYFADKRDVSAYDLAGMLLAIYEYSKDIKDNKTLEKISTDFLMLYRLTRFYDENRKEK